MWSAQNGETPPQTRLDRDVLLAVDAVSHGLTDDTRRHLALPQDFPGPHVEGVELLIGRSAEHQSAVGRQRPVVPGEARIHAPFALAGCDFDGLQRAPTENARNMLRRKLSLR